MKTPEELFKEGIKEKALNIDRLFYMLKKYEIELTKEEKIFWKQVTVFLER